MKDKIEICIICECEFKKKHHAQKICGSIDCKRESRKRTIKKYYDNHKSECKERSIKWQNGNKNKLRIIQKRTRIKNKTKRLKAFKEWYYKNNGKQKAKEWGLRNKDKKAFSFKKWYENNKNYHNEYREKNLERARKIEREYNRKKRLKIEIRLKNSISERIRAMIKKKGSQKINTAVDYLGCNQKEFLKYIESKFQNGMTFDNYGKFGWHIDHIIPCSAFDLTKEEEQKKCFHYTNLQPLWWRDNIIKSNKILKSA
jgi:hypothetical protein